MNRVDSLAHASRQHLQSLEPGASAAPRPGFGSELTRAEEIAGAANSSGGSETSPGKKPSDLIRLGTISRENPTVSHLLVDNPAHGRECWDIVYDRINEGKPYRYLPEGQPVYLDPQTREIVFDPDGPRREPSSVCSNRGEPQTVSPSYAFNPAKPLSPQIVDQVRTYLGTSYDKVDCYELVVHGLRGLGVQYYGTDGLKDSLVDRAESRDEPSNRYLTGEGLVAASGDAVYTRVFTPGGDPQKHADKVFEDLSPSLEEGMVLSFSTRSRGHTGIVARHEGSWTFINSGVIDHDVHSGPKSRRVGEEELKAEISNWLKLAENLGESLRLSVGRFDHQKLAHYMPDHRSLA